MGEGKTEKEFQGRKSHNISHTEAPNDNLNFVKKGFFERNIFFYNINHKYTHCGVLINLRIKKLKCNGVEKLKQYSI